MSFFSIWNGRKGGSAVSKPGRTENAGNPHFCLPRAFSVSLRTSGVSWAKNSFEKGPQDERGPGLECFLFPLPTLPAREPKMCHFWDPFGTGMGYILIISGPLLPWGSFKGLFIPNEVWCENGFNVLHMGMISNVDPPSSLSYISVVRKFTDKRARGPWEHNSKGHNQKSIFGESVAGHTILLENPVLESANCVRPFAPFFWPMPI